MPLSDLHARKKRTNLAILGALCAWVVLIFIVALIRMMPAQSAPVEPAYAVNPRYQACAQDADYVLVSTTCNGCCQRDAINAAFVQQYRQENKVSCKGPYKGAVCDCIELPAEAKCQSGKCAFVPTSPAASTP